MANLVEYNDPSYYPSALTPKQIRKIAEERADGVYTAKSTYDETIVCVKQLKQNKDDKVITLMHKYGVFNKYNLKEFLPQVSSWKELGCRLLKCNIFDINCGKEGKVKMFIIQPPTNKMNDVSISPLAYSFGVLVSGYAYITTDEQLVEMVWKYLGSHE